ncbi:MAG: AraC family transcriptional regulator [Eubacteriales bacterium]|nr:AraC family transcriptional regulator [Eubacteriales bacterium]
MNNMHAFSQEVSCDSLLDSLFFYENQIPRMKNIIHVSNCPIYSYRSHAHASWAEIVLIAGGQGVYHVGRERYEVQAGDVLLINRMVLHSCESSPSDALDAYTLSLCEFQIVDLEPGMLLPADTCPLIKTGDQFPFVRELFSQLLFQSSEKRPGYRMVCDHIIFVLCRFFHQYIQDSCNHIRSKSISQLASEVLEYIEENFTSNITLEGLSKRFFVTPKHLCHIMSTECGISPIDYVIRKRINSAQWRLVMEDTSIKDIAYALGYESQDYFTKQFQKRTGMTPSTYRSRYSKVLKFVSP